MSRSKGAGQRMGCVALDRIGTTRQCPRTRRRRGVVTWASSSKEGRGKDALAREDAIVVTATARRISHTPKRGGEEDDVIVGSTSGGGGGVGALE